jgi:hypothetical protein
MGVATAAANGVFGVVGEDGAGEAETAEDGGCDQALVATAHTAS